MADPERHGHPEPDRLRPVTHLRVHEGGVAGLRRQRRLQPVRRAERQRRGLRHPDPGDLLPEQPLVAQRLQRTFDVLRVEPGQPREPGLVGAVDRAADWRRAAGLGHCSWRRRSGQLAPVVFIDLDDRWCIFITRQ